jgi:hypothetical protein
MRKSEGRSLPNSEKMKVEIEGVQIPFFVRDVDKFLTPSFYSVYGDWVLYKNGYGLPLGPGTYQYPVKMFDLFTLFDQISSHGKEGKSGNARQARNRRRR